MTQKFTGTLSKPASPAEVPAINIRCERSDGATRSAYLNPVRVELEDDGALTVVTDHWPAGVPDCVYDARGAKFLELRVEDKREDGE